MQVWCGAHCDAQRRDLSRSRPAARTGERESGAAPTRAPAGRATAPRSTAARPAARAARCANRTRPPLRSLAAEGASASGRAERPRFHSCPTHSSRAAALSAPATPRLSGCTHALGARCPMQQVDASHERSARLPSGTWSRVGMGMGVGYRAHAWVGTHPVNRSQLDRRWEFAARSRPIVRWIGERFGHGPATASDRRSQAGRERRTRGRSAGRDINVWPPR